MPRRKSRWTRSAAALLSVWGALAAAAERGDSAGFIQRSEEEVLILAVRLDAEVLSTGMSAYPARGGVLLPLGELCRLLGLAIEVDPARRSAGGFFIDERRTLNVDFAAQRALVEGRPARYLPEQIEVHADDVYVHSELMGSWLPLDLRVDLFGALVTVVPREPLPRQLQGQRRHRQEQVLASLAVGQPRYPALELPGRWWDGPAVDQTLRLALLRSRSEAPESSQVDFSTYATAELAHLDASAYLAGSQRGLADYRVRLGRRDPDRRLLGPLRASEVAVGDVFFPGVELISLPRAGPGLLLTNSPLEQPLEYDRHTFVGELPPGWEAELYRNDVLLGFQEPRAGGRYQFSDVPLLFGLNVFRLVLHGPQGQRRERVERFDVGQQLTPPGELRYRVAASAAPELDRQAAAELELGVGKHLALNGALASQLSPQGALRHFGKVGLRSFWQIFSASADAAYEVGGGLAAQASLRTLLGEVGLTAEHLQLWGFQSERLPSQFGPLVRRSTARVDGALPFPLITRLPLQLQARHERYLSGEVMTFLSGRSSAYLRGVAVSNELGWSFPRPGSTLPSQALGTGLLSYSLPWISVRGQLNYELSPEPKVSALALSAEGRLLPGYSFTAGVVHSPQETLYVASVGKAVGMVGLGIDASYSLRSGAVLSLTLTASLVRLPASGGWHLQAQPAAGAGAALVRAFLDHNGNGQRDPGEPLLPEVGFSVNRSLLPERTGLDGVTLIPNLPGNLPLDLALDTSTLEDPFWRPARPGVRLVPRPGKVVELDFPVVVTGEISGTVYLRREGRDRPQPGVELELLAADGREVQKVSSAFDGFYTFVEVPPGRYTLRASGEQLARARLLPPLPRTVELAASGTVVDGVDLVLEPLKAGPPAPAR